MSAATLPYHLRPHKAVDRRLFIDLLGRSERWRPLDRAAYISMGAYPLEDHKMVHRKFGIGRLIAFDYDEKIVERQKFNRPVDSFHAIKSKSGDFIDKLDEYLQEAECGDADNLVIWLDYTSPKQLGNQIREFEQLLDKLALGDIVRVTVNAQLSALHDARDKEGKLIEAEPLRELRLEKLRSRIGDYLPTDAASADMTDERLPVLISRAFGAAAAKAKPTSGRDVFAPLSSVRYADGQQMLSMTGMLISRDEKTVLYNRLGMETWPFWSQDWKTVYRLSVPDLTLRERLHLEREVAEGSFADTVKELGFVFEKNDDAQLFVDSYRKFYRFYPNLLPAEL